MSDSKKKRMSMLDNLAAASTPSPSSMMTSNRPLRAARDAVDSHQVWDLDPALIEDTRVADRLDPSDVIDLRDSIEATGQTVPILVRRHPSDPERYLLVYGRRRLEAIRGSNTVLNVRALIANLDDSSAVEAQISENMARRDLTYIEKALFSHELIESGFGNQSKVAEVLTVTKSSVSMALGVIAALGPDLVRVIGPAPGIGRPRWDALAQAVEASHLDADAILEIAHKSRDMAMLEPISNDGAPDQSVSTFEAVMAALATHGNTTKQKSKSTTVSRDLSLGGQKVGRVTRSATSVRLDLGRGDFADWIEDQAQDLIDELHARWNERRKT